MLVYSLTHTAVSDFGICRDAASSESDLIARTVYRFVSLKVNCYIGLDCNDIRNSTSVTIFRIVIITGIPAALRIFSAGYSENNYGYRIQ